MNALMQAEALVPAMCQMLAIEGMGTEGYTISPQHEQALFNHFHVLLGKIAKGNKQEAITKAYTTAEAIMRGEHNGSWRQLVLTASMFACKLVAEGLPIDPQSQPVLVGLALLDEAENHDDTGEWGFNKKQLEESAGRMLSRARLLGLFLDNSLAH